MYKEQLVAVNECKNAGDNCELAIRRHFGCKPDGHDSKAYNLDSDCNFGNMHMSVKGSKFTLMSAKFCKGCETFDDIWNRFESDVHSNTFVYVTVDFTAYFMNIIEFKALVYAFGHVDRESSKNGGGKKIRFAEESKKVRNYLEHCCEVSE